MTKKEKAKDGWLRRKYGITIFDYKKMVKKQRNRCAICGRPPKKLALAVDHNHKSGKVRGLLCMTCNRKALGILERFKISPQWVVDYLKYYDSENPLLTAKRLSGT